MGQIINQFPGGGEDVTKEVNVQTPLVEDILESLVGKVYDANATPDKILEGYSAYVHQELVTGSLDPETLKQGEYAWKVYTYEEEISVENPTFTGDVNNPSTNYIKITQSSFDKTLIEDIYFFAGFDAGNGTNKFDYDEGVLKYFWGTGSTQKWQVFSYNPETGEILTGNAPYNGTFNFSYTGKKVLRTARKGTFVGYVISDTSDKYPDNDRQNEFYYEKVTPYSFDLSKFGYTKAAAGTVTYAENNRQDIDIVHNLGTPVKMLIMELVGNPTEALSVTKWLSLMLDYNGKSSLDNEDWFYGGGRVVIYSGSPPESYGGIGATVAGAESENNRFYASFVQALSNTCYFDTGTYRWIAMA